MTLAFNPALESEELRREAGEVFRSVGNWKYGKQGRTETRKEKARQKEVGFRKPKISVAR